MSRSDQRGFSVVELVLGIVIVAAIAVTGYLALHRMKDASKTPTASDQTQKSTVPTATSIQKTSDLDSASKTLDDTNIDATTTDTTDLDTQVNNF